MITCVNVEDRGFVEGYDDEFREAGGDDEFRENEGYAFGENEGGDVEDVSRYHEQGHANYQKKGILVGYNESSKAYRVYIPGYKQIETSRDVTFNEDASFSK